ncbi:MAG: hypothetical protein LBH50_02590 [Spirochaetaceae bacterium]|jgi:DNA-directed RNA polymerase specialized sigma24 family protein|nr:hypothetical protein [Spirochaetaceae bacterium]
MDGHGGPLENFYRRHKAGNITERELESRIFEYVMNSRSNEYGLYFKNRDERVDFLCWVYPRIRKAIERYDSACASFDAYLASTIRYSYRNYRSREHKQSAAETACWNASGDETAVRDPEAVYQEAECLAAAYRIRSPTRALLVLLKSYYYVSDGLVNKAARALGMKAEILGSMIDTLHNAQFKKIMRLQKLAGATHCLYFRCLGYERRLAERHENSRSRELLLLRLKQGRQRLEDMRRRLRSARVEATNSSLARLLGVPKGTIDSRLASIRSRMSANKWMF